MSSRQKPRFFARPAQGAADVVMSAQGDEGDFEPMMLRRRTRWLLIVTAAFVVVGIAAAAYWFFYARQNEETDDAYVAGDLVNVSSQVSGTVVSIGADETDFVQTGQEVVKLDDTDARIALQEAEDQLAKVVRQVRTVFTSR